MAQNGCFMPRWANFFAEMRLEGPRWGNFFAEMSLEGLCGANFFAETPLEGQSWASFSRASSRGNPPGEFVVPCAWQPGPSTGSINPSMRSGALLVAWWAACPGHHLSG